MAAPAAAAEAPAAVRASRENKPFRYTSSQVEHLEKEHEAVWLSYKEAHKRATLEYAESIKKKKTMLKGFRATDVATKWDAKIEATRACVPSRPPRPASRVRVLCERER